jgi:hypothetical protein
MENYAIITNERRTCFEYETRTLADCLLQWEGQYFTKKGRKLVKVGNYPCRHEKRTDFNVEKEPVFPITEIIKIGV